jgi:hypothetical protein
MGVKGLVALLRWVMVDSNLDRFAGTVVPIDTHTLLHRFSSQGANYRFIDGGHCAAVVKSVLNVAHQLQVHRIVPLFVLDGPSSEGKRGEAAKRSAAKQRALEALRASANSMAGEDAEVFKAALKSWEETGSACPLGPDENSKERAAHIVRVVDSLSSENMKHVVTLGSVVSQRMVGAIVNAFQAFCFQYVVAPHDADSQLAWEVRGGGRGSVACSIDSDMILLCKKAVFPHNGSKTFDYRKGRCTLFDLDSVKQKLAAIHAATTTGAPFPTNVLHPTLLQNATSGATKPFAELSIAKQLSSLASIASNGWLPVLRAAALAGSDFSTGLNGVALPTSLALFSSLKEPNKPWNELQEPLAAGARSLGLRNVAACIANETEWLQNVVRAESCFRGGVVCVAEQQGFCHQRYDPFAHEISPSAVVQEVIVSSLPGFLQAHNIATGLAEGRLVTETCGTIGASPVLPTTGPRPYFKSGCLFKEQDLKDTARLSIAVEQLSGLVDVISVLYQTFSRKRVVVLNGPKEEWTAAQCQAYLENRDVVGWSNLNMEQLRSLCEKVQSFTDTYLHGKDFVLVRSENRARKGPEAVRELATTTELPGVADGYVLGLQQAMDSVPLVPEVEIARWFLKRADYKGNPIKAQQSLNDGALLASANFVLLETARHKFEESAASAETKVWFAVKVRSAKFKMVTYVVVVQGVVEDKNTVSALGHFHIRTASCNCCVGKSETCKHVSAAIWAFVDITLRRRLATCTQVLCAFNEALGKAGVGRKGRRRKLEAYNTIQPAAEALRDNSRSALPYNPDRCRRVDLSSLAEHFREEKYPAAAFVNVWQEQREERQNLKVERRAHLKRALSKSPEKPPPKSTAPPLSPRFSLPNE